MFVVVVVVVVVVIVLRRTHSHSFHEGITWHHLCVIWTKKNGKWLIYINGKQVKSKNSYRENESIEGGGTLTVAQFMKSDGTIDSSRSYVGDLSHLNIWSSVVEQDEIEVMSRGCVTAEGNHVRWSAFRENIKGSDVTVAEPAECTLPGMSVISLIVGHHRSSSVIVGDRW